MSVLLPVRRVGKRVAKPSPDSSVPVLRDDAEALRVATALAERFRPGASSRDRERRLPFDEVKELAASGLLGITVPRSHGGADVSMVTLANVFRILAAADGSLGQIPQNHFVFVDAIRGAGTPAQKKFFFEQFLKGQHLGNALKEPDMITKDGHNLRTTFTKTRGGYVINGRKTYCTGALFAPWVPVFVTDDQKRVFTAYVKRGTPGMTIHDDWSGMGQRTTASGTTTFDNVFVPDRFVVHRYKVAGEYHGTSGFAQIMHAGIDAGIAEEALHDTIDFIRTRARVSPDSGLDRHADEPYVIRRVGELALQLNAANALVRRAGELLDIARREGQGTEQTEIDATLAVGEARFATDAVALAITNELFTLNGASATREEFNLDRHWRNARTHTLHDPPYWKTFNLGNYLINGRKPRGLSAGRGDLQNPKSVAVNGR
ncbi:MAG: SfnB family sulfur acquisition oxidoreductase [Rariglobus sp.]